MRFWPFYLALVCLLPGCGKTNGPVRLDLIGASNLTSSNRTVDAADTVATRLFAESSGAGQSLRRLTVTVAATPTRRPFLYPAALSAFKLADVPADTLQTLLDSTLAPGTRSLFFQITLTARATVGTERFEFSVTDSDNNTATRAYRLTVRRSDSLATVQTYTLLARPGRRAAARPYVALRTGQLLPAYAGRPILAQNYRLIDLVVVETADGVRLAAPNAPALIALPDRWPNPRATRLHPTSLDNAGFGNPSTAPQFQNSFNTTGTYPNNVESYTDVLVKGNVIVFKTADGRHGFIQIADITRTPYTALKLSVRMAKEAL